MQEFTRGIAGVRGVENLLHLPGTPAPASRPKLGRDRRAVAIGEKTCARSACGFAYGPTGGGLGVDPVVGRASLAA